MVSMNFNVTVHRDGAVLNVTQMLMNAAVILVAMVDVSTVSISTIVTALMDGLVTTVILVTLTPFTYEHY